MLDDVLADKVSCLRVHSNCESSKTKLGVKYDTIFHTLYCVLGPSRGSQLSGEDRMADVGATFSRAGNRVPHLGCSHGAVNRRDGHHLGTHRVPGGTGLRYLRETSHDADGAYAHGVRDTEFRLRLELWRTVGLSLSDRGRRSDDSPQLYFHRRGLLPPCTTCQGEGVDH